MNVVLVGLTPRDQAALGLFLGRSLKGWTWRVCELDRVSDCGARDILVLDLASLGMGRHSADAEAALASLINHRAAVLLVSRTDESWQAADRAASPRAAWVWLGKPYGSDGMREALAQVASIVKQVTAPNPKPHRMSIDVTWLPEPRFTPSARPPEPGPMVEAADAEDEAHGLTPADLQARLAQTAESGRYVFLRSLSDKLLQKQPFEARFTMQHCLVVHPQDGWVAANTPMAVMERVCNSDALACAVTMHALTSAEAEDLTQRLGMAPMALDVFLSQLVRASLDQAAPTASLYN